MWRETVQTGANYALANGIWYALIVLGLISWAVSLVRKIRSVI